MQQDLIQNSINTSLFTFWIGFLCLLSSFAWGYGASPNITLSNPNQSKVNLDYASEKKESPSYQACGAITREYITAVQLYQKGFALETLKKTLPGLTPKGAKRLTEIFGLLKKNGVLPIYSNIHSKYAECAKSVYKSKGIPARNSREYNYYFCAGEDKLRYEIALAIYLKGPKEEVLPQIPLQRRAIASYYYQIAGTKGIEAVFDLLAHSFKSCLIRADAAPPSL
jgi:hypothetical protein